MTPYNCYTLLTNTCLSVQLYNLLDLFQTRFNMYSRRHIGSYKGFPSSYGQFYFDLFKFLLFFTLFTCMYIFCSLLFVFHFTQTIAFLLSFLFPS